MPKGDLTVYCFLEAAPGKADELLAILSKAKEYCDNHEPGCLQYRISHDPNDKHKVGILEVFKDEDALEFHMESQVSKNNVEFYKNGGLAKPLEEQDIRIYSEHSP